MPSSYTLGEHYETFIRELVESGRYNSASEVVRDAMRLLEDAEVLRSMRNEELKKLIQEGIDSGDAGPLDMEEIIAEARQRKASRSNAA
jgi:antitoxin ParD1/3/4